MIINRKNTEFRDSPHEIWAEGAEDDPMNEDEVYAYCADCGYKALSIDIWFDGMQSIWRWRCDIKPIIKNKQQVK